MLDGVGDQLRDDQQQPLQDLVLDRHALAAEEVAHGVPGPGHGHIDGGAVKRHTPSYDTGSAGGLPRLSIVRHQLSLALH